MSSLLTISLEEKDSEGVVELWEKLIPLLLSGDPTIPRDIYKEKHVYYSPVERERNNFQSFNEQTEDEGNNNLFKHKSSSFFDLGKHNGKYYKGKIASGKKNKHTHKTNNNLMADSTKIEKKNEIALENISSTRNGQDEITPPSVSMTTQFQSETSPKSENKNGISTNRNILNTQFGGQKYLKATNDMYSRIPRDIYNEKLVYYSPGRAERGDNFQRFLEYTEDESDDNSFRLKSSSYFDMSKSGAKYNKRVNRKRNKHIYLTKNNLIPDDAGQEASAKHNTNSDTLNWELPFEMKVTLDISNAGSGQKEIRTTPSVSTSAQFQSKTTTKVKNKNVTPSYQNDLNSLSDGQTYLTDVSTTDMYDNICEIHIISSKEMTSDKTQESLRRPSLNYHQTTVSTNFRNISSSNNLNQSSVTFSTLPTITNDHNSGPTLGKINTTNKIIIFNNSKVTEHSKYPDNIATTPLDSFNKLLTTQVFSPEITKTTKIVYPEITTKSSTSDITTKTNEIFSPEITSTIVSSGITSFNYTNDPIMTTCYTINKTLTTVSNVTSSTERSTFIVVNKTEITTSGYSSTNTQPTTESITPVHQSTTILTTCMPVTKSDEKETIFNLTTPIAMTGSDSNILQQPHVPSMPLLFMNSKVLVPWYSYIGFNNLQTPTTSETPLYNFPEPYYLPVHDDRQNKGKDAIFVPIYLRRMPEPSNIPSRFVEHSVQSNKYMKPQQIFFTMPKPKEEERKPLFDNKIPLFYKYTNLNKKPSYPMKNRGIDRQPHSYRNLKNTFLLNIPKSVKL